ncbi:MAG: hypothetical protein U0Q12_24260 [Vicinamibacterales bacterium]
MSDSGLHAIASAPPILDRASAAGGDAAGQRPGHDRRQPKPRAPTGDPSAESDAFVSATAPPEDPAEEVRRLLERSFAQQELHHLAQGDTPSAASHSPVDAHADSQAPSGALRRRTAYENPPSEPPALDRFDTTG